MSDLVHSNGWRQVVQSQGFKVVVLVVMCGSVYANLAHGVTDPRDYRYFPPFRSGYNRNLVDHLGAEYLNVARAICSGRGFADPFDRETGPTAWMPPVLPYLLAGFWCATGGNLDAVTNVFVGLHCAALVWTGAFVLYAWRRDRPRYGAGLVVIVLVLEVVVDFRNAFQITHDHFLVLSVLNGLVLWAGWGYPLVSRPRAVGWGLFGGFAALSAPTLGLVWAGLTLVAGIHMKTVSRIILTSFCAGATVTPWMVRNYATFGRMIPIKSNANFELYQSQCMQPDGVLQQSSIGMHPRSTNSEQAREYDELGEDAFLARKGDQFRAAVRADPEGFAARVGDRFIAVVLWYTPRDRSGLREFAPGVWLARALHPLPWIAVVVIVLAIGRPPTPGERVAALAAVLYVLPYILVSYDDRYYYPLLGLRTLLVLFLVDRLVECVRLRSLVSNPAERAFRRPANRILPAGSPSAGESGRG